MNHLFVKCDTWAEYVFLQQKLTTKFLILDDPISKWEEDWNDDYVYVGILDNEVYVSTVEELEWNDQVIPMWDMLRIFETYTPEPTIRLTDDYNAIVTPEAVVVGCQIITFEKVRELYALIPKE